MLGRTVCGIGLAIAIASAQTGKLDRASESALIAAMEDLQKAIETRDEGMLRKRLADDFVIVHTRGARESREGFIALVLRGQALGQVEGSQVRWCDRSIRVVGTDIAVINENMNLRRGTRSLWRSDVAVWRRRSGMWQAVYHQGTPIGEGIIENGDDRANYPRLAGQYKTSDGRAFSVDDADDHLLMFGPESLERQDLLIPQGGLEYQIAPFGTIKFALDGNQVSATALQNGKAVWTATRSRQ